MQRFGPNQPQPLRRDRLRKMERPFGWIPFRILSAGWLQQLEREAKLLYLFLCLVADAQGVSYYGDARLCRLLDLTLAELERARDGLCCRDLLAFDGRVYQLLSLPADAAAQCEPAERHDQEECGKRLASDLAHIRQIIRSLEGRE